MCLVVVVLVTVVVGSPVVGEAAVAGVAVGAGDGVAGCADGGGCRRCRCCSWGGGVGMGDPYPGGGVVGGTVCEGESVDGAAFGGVAEGVAGVAGIALVVSACGSRSQLVNRAMPPVRMVLVVSVTVRLMPLVRAVWLSCQALVVLVMLIVVCWRFVPVMVLRW